MLGICTSTFAQSPTDSLDIKVTLKDEYVIGEIINFEYFNKTQKHLRVHIIGRARKFGRKGGAVKTKKEG
jgi:hypothetical protein